MLSMLSVDFIRVMPIAWDDSNLYMRGAKLFATKMFSLRELAQALGHYYKALAGYLPTHHS